jgi:microcystin-dependent protein
MRWVAFTFAPQGWQECNGQLLAIQLHTDLFQLIGTTYGGDGQNTFALPDMRGRMPMHAGQGPGLTDRIQGTTGGEENVTLTPAQMPAHSHDLKGSSTEANLVSPAGNLPATKARVALYAPGPVDTTMSPLAIGQVGGSQPHDNMPPFLVVKCIIKVEPATFPSPQ